MSNQLHLAYRSTYTDDNKLKHSSAGQCYYCSNYYGRRDKYERPLENCSGMQCVIYNFGTQNLVTFEENLEYNGNLPLVAYVDFETTAPTDLCLDPGNKKILRSSICFSSGIKI